MTMPSLSNPMKIFLWIIAGLWLGGGVIAFFLFDRHTGMLVLLSFVMVVGLFGLATLLLWVVKRIFELLHMEFRLDGPVLDKDIEIGSKLKALFAGAPDSEKPQRTLVLSAKAETTSPLAEHQKLSNPGPVDKKHQRKTDAKAMFDTAISYLGVAAVFLAVPTAIVWLITGSREMFLFTMKYLLAIGLPLLLLSLFETGRKVLTILFYVLRVFLVIFEFLSLFSGGRGGRSVSGGFSGGGGGFDGGGASGKW
jgi:hypothetical protein